LALPFAFYFLVRSNDFDTLSSSTRFNSLYLNLKANNKFALLHTPLFLLRRLALALTITLG
jgi:hypothetical protein